MNRTFKQRAIKILVRLPQSARAQARQDMLILFKSGVTSVSDCIALVENPTASLKLRRIACWVIGKMKVTNVTDALLIAFNSGDLQLCWEAANALAHLHSKKAVKALISFLQEAREPWRRKAAAYALGFIMDKRATVPLIKVLGNSMEQPDVRGQAAEALGYIKDRRAVKPLITALKDDCIEIRFWSAFALGAIGDRRAIPELRRVAKTDSSTLKGWWSVKKEARDAIQQM